MYDVIFSPTNLDLHRNYRGYLLDLENSSSTRWPKSPIQLSAKGFIDDTALKIEL